MWPLHPAAGRTTWTLCGGRLAPRRANERYTAEPPACARLVSPAYHRRPGSTTCRPPNASTRSLLMPTEQGLSTPGHSASIPPNADHLAPGWGDPNAENTAPTYF